MKMPHWDRRTLYRNTAFVLALVCLALIANQIFGDRGWLALRHQKREFESLQQQILKLHEENQQLEEQVKALKSDPKAIEKVAREQLHFARPGEIVITLPEKDTKTQTSSATEKRR